MGTFLELQRKVEDLQEKYGAKHFIFIGPYSLKKAQELKLFDYYVYNQIQPDPSLCAGISKLDIYFVERIKISGMKRGNPIPFSRLSSVNLSEL